MIFVTVGTHEQQFNRLVSYIDKLKADGVIDEEVIIQTGFSTYCPKNCKWSKLIPYNEMEQNIMNARIVVTHGGPASFIMPLRMGKIPIVVPRQVEFFEHVNNHQLDFCREVAKRKNNIIVIDNIEDLKSVIFNYEKIISDMNSKIQSSNKAFNDSIEKIVTELFNK